jgi:uracil-DNA glycosylase
MMADLFGDASAAEPVPRLSSWSPEAWHVQPDWQAVLQRFWQSAEGVRLAEFVKARLAAGAVVYPQHPLWALSLTALVDVRVVILGQDPYHGPHQAQGLAFSVGDGVKLPPSLRNIFKEINRDLQLPIPKRGSLEAWARRGVLLLNTSLTVEDGQPASHAKRGWEVLTDALLVEVARTVPRCAYLLWGGHAQVKQGLIESAGRAAGQDALVLMANHPSPLSALRPPQPFMGCGHFSQVQRWWAEKNQPIDWAL